MTGARPVNRGRFNREADFPNRNQHTYHPQRCMAPLDRRLNMKTSRRVALCRSARRIREKEYLWNRNIRVPAGNKDIPACCRLLRPSSLTP